MVMTEAEKISALEARVLELEGQVAVFIERAKDDDESFRQLAELINEYCKRHEQAIAGIDERVAETLSRHVTDVYAQVSREFGDAVAEKIVSSEVVKALSQKVLVVRPAQRHELATAIPTRPAQRHEL